MTIPHSRTLPQLGQSLTDQVMNHVRHSVGSGEMEVGRLYSVYQLAEQLGISRSPVRDGLLRLEEAGLIEFSRNRGFRVIPTSPHDVAEIFSLRLALEVPAALRAAHANTPALAATFNDLEAHMRSAAERGSLDEFFDLDQQVHDTILSAAGSNRGRGIVNRLRDSTRLLGVSTAGKERSLTEILGEHAPVIEAINAGKGQEAAAAMREHLTRTGQLLVSQAITAQHLDLDPDELWREYTTGY